MQIGVHNVQAGLDRDFVNGQWLTDYANAKLFHIETVGSDHSAIILVTNP